MSNKKLSEKQLKEVQDLNQTFLQIKVRIADAEVSKNKSIQELDVIQQKFSEVEKKLIEEFGDNASIDLKTGDVKLPEKENKDNGENK